MSEAIGIGSTVWVQIGNYNRIGKDRWKPFTITGETRVSWVFIDRGDTRKFPKKLPKDERVRWSPTWNSRDRVALTETERDDLILVEMHARRIGEDVACCQDPAILRQVAALVGYVEEKTDAE